MEFFKNMKIETKILTGFVFASVLSAILTLLPFELIISNVAASAKIVSIIGVGLLTGIYISKLISKQLSDVITAADKLAAGDINIEINSSLKGEAGQLFNSFKKIIANTSYQTSIVKQMAEGKLNVEIEPKSDKDILSIELLNMSKSISKQLKTLITAADKIACGDIDVEINSTWEDEIGQLSNSFKKIIANTSYQASIVKQIAEGKLNVEIQPKSEKDMLSIELLNMLQTINSVSLEMNKLSQAVSEGILDTRAEGKGCKGDWIKVVEGLNNLMNTFMYYVNIMEEYFDGVSKGAAMDKITNSAKGEWENVRLNINGLLDNLYGMSDDVKMLVKAGAEGNFKLRADALKHQGGYKTIVEGINTLLDEVAKPLTEFEEVLSEMAKGSLKAAVKGNYKGEMSIMKDNLNHVINGVYDHIEETSKVLNQMAKGNLDVEIKGEYNGDYIDLKEATNKIIKSLNETLGEIDTAAEQVSAGAKLVSDSSQSLSQGSTEQAASIEEITSSVTEITAQTKDNAVNAGKANEMAESVKENADEGNKQMQSVLKAMEEINESSNSISKIIKVIDDIAFQTNILALNAAVEAARAGQHGKGFAVVAEEVRNLAARSANAAKETTEMIEESIKKAENGKKITEVTAEKLNKVTEHITTVAEIVNGIAAASNEQAAAIGQINQAIEEVSQVTQTNTATAEESASASEELSSQAVLVKDRIGRFILKKESKSGNSYKNIDEKTLRLIENMLSGKDNNESCKTSYNQAAASISPKISISLDDNEFGKY